MKPKKLTLDEMWKLYRIIKPSLQSEQKDRLIDEIEAMLDNAPSGMVRSSLSVLYAKPERFSDANPLEFLLLFVVGIKKNKFFKFVEFMSELSNGHAKQRV